MCLCCTFPFLSLWMISLFTIFAFTMMLFLVRRFSLARREEERLSNEFAAARSIQSLLVPVASPATPGFAVESVYIPATEVGGDFFQVQPGDDGSLLIVVGDVSGKGLKAAMTVSTIVGSLRSFPSRAPAEVLITLNRVLHGQISGFVTCCAALISADGMLTMANAGHLSPYRNGEELAVQAGLPLGMLAEGAYDETRYQLAPGDRLTFLSDGVIEARKVKGELYGFERTQQIGNQTAAVIAHAARQFGQEDDITVVTVARALAPAL
jgi:phosphoserine phosphatase RsbU/P